MWHINAINVVIFLIEEKYAENVLSILNLLQNLSPLMMFMKQKNKDLNPRCLFFLNFLNSYLFFNIILKIMIKAFG